MMQNNNYSLLAYSIVDPVVDLAIPNFNRLRDMFRGKVWAMSELKVRLIKEGLT